MQSATITTSLLPLLPAGSLFGAASARAEDEPHYSGFLGDASVYTRLQEVEIRIVKKLADILAGHLYHLTSNP